jgi:hypothetical protein
MAKVLFAVVLLACSGDHPPDVCTASSSYGAASIAANGSGYAFTAAQIAADASTGLTDSNQGFDGDITADATPDMFEIDLYQGYGACKVGSGAIATGNFTLSGDDLSFQGCGVCLQLYTDLGSDGAPTDLYFATAGSVTLTSVGTPTGSDVSMGTLAGSIANVAFAHWDDNNDVAVGDCTSSVGSLQFSATLAPLGTNGAQRLVGHRTR